MHITYKGDYALKTILDLALHYGNSPVSMPDLAKRADIPIKFLEQIVSDLKRGGFVESRRGSVGGYLLARDPAQIKLGEIVRFIDGPIEPVACVHHNYDGCSDIKKCIFRDIWQRVADSTSEIIDNITFADLVGKINNSTPSLAYQI